MSKINICVYNGSISSFVNMVRYFIVWAPVAVFNLDLNDSLFHLPFLQARFCFFFLNHFFVGIFSEGTCNKQLF